MDFSLPYEIKALQENARRFTEEELIPLEREVIENEMHRGLDVAPFQPKPGEHYLVDPDGVIPPEACERLVRKAREASLWGLDVPEDLGGLGLGVVARMAVTEEISRSLVPFVLPPDAPNLHWMLSVCTDEQRERYLKPYARGEVSICTAVTEPNAGSDVSALETTATRRGDKWVLNGRKMFINRADWASYLIVMAVNDKSAGRRGGITAFIVDRNAPGLKVQRRIATIAAERPCEITLDDVEVDDSAVLGKVGWAFGDLQDRFSIRRLEFAMRSIGASERLLELLVQQARTRKTFGAPLADRQAVQWWIADATTGIHAARLMCYHAAWKVDNGHSDIRLEASIAKAYATELVGRIADWTIQAHGAMGVAKEMPIEFFYRLVRLWRIVEGPTEVHKYVIARNRLKGKRPLIDPTMRA